MTALRFVFTPAAAMSVDISAPPTAQRVWRCGVEMPGSGDGWGRAGSTRWTDGEVQPHSRAPLGCHGDALSHSAKQGTTGLLKLAPLSNDGDEKQATTDPCIFTDGSRMASSETVVISKRPDDSPQEKGIIILQCWAADWSNDWGGRTEGGRTHQRHGPDLEPAGGVLLREPGAGSNTPGLVCY